MKYKLEQTLDEMFNEAQAKLPEEDRCALKSDKPYCMHHHEGYHCTKAIGHKGDHIAHGRLGTIIKRWL